MWTSLLAGLTIGILGGLHCIGMCGPLALSIPFPSRSKSARAIAILVYNLGRVLTYTVIGIIFGWIGMQFSLFGWQQILSFMLGVLLLMGAMATIFHKRLFSLPGINKIWNHLFGTFFGSLLRKANYSSVFIIGLLNGLLPCGLVYVALAGALASGNILEGATFMFGFGMATLPAMMSVSFAGALIKANWQRWLKKSSPYVIAFMACLLILRGLNLNIPYLSPQLVEDKVECCSPNNTVSLEK